MLFFTSSNGLSLHTPRNHWAPHTRNYYRYGNVMVMESLRHLVENVNLGRFILYYNFTESQMQNDGNGRPYYDVCVCVCACVCACVKTFSEVNRCVWLNVPSRPVRRLQLCRFIKFPSVNCRKYLSLTNILLGQKVLNSVFCCYKY